MSNNFHFQGAFNSVIYSFEEEMNSENNIRVSLDLQLPHHVTGDEEGLTVSITRIIKFLNQQLHEGMIDIEISKVSQSNEIIRVKVDMRGTDRTYRTSKRKSFVENSSKLEWLKAMPYKTHYIRHPNYYFFSFSMSFQHNEVNTNK